jgi:sodium-dependent dicarboxylate transporter 2/3/5
MASDEHSETELPHNRWLLRLPAVIGLLVLVTPVPTGMNPEAHRLIAVTVLMAGLWITQAVPLAATSLLPLALFPLLGIMKPDEVSKAYINDTLFLYIGGMIIALGIERWQLHRRIALHLVSIVGVSPRRLVLGFLISTAALSMWISNTACTLMMLPIALAMLKTLDDADAALPSAARIRQGHTTQLAAPLLMSIAYSASLGGMMTLVGTPTNSSAAGIYRDQLPHAPEVTMADWIMTCGPIGIVYLAVTWFVLTRGLAQATSADRALEDDLKLQLRSLGPATSAEFRMMLVFGLTGLLWITRTKLVIGSVTLLPGWLDGFRAFSQMLTGSTAALKGDIISDATVSMTMAVLLFFLPSGTRDRTGRSIPLMDWPTANRLPWDMILLFGGGFALADGFRTTELSAWLGSALQAHLHGQSPWVVVAVLCTLMIFLTELTSNVATVNTVMPTLLAMAAPLGMDARLIFIPVTLAASCGFMLPIGTPPNAIVFSTGRISSRQMAGYGLILNLVGTPILTLGTFLIIGPLLIDGDSQRNIETPAAAPVATEKHVQPEHLKIPSVR